MPSGTRETPGEGVTSHSSPYVRGTDVEKIPIRVDHPYDAAVPEATMTLPSDPRSVPQARQFVVRHLEAWGCDEATWAAAQIVSELATNCALHARTEYDIRLVQDDTGLRLEVRDSSPARVRQRSYSSSSTTGRGLRLVDDLCRSWGVDLHTDGKTVWVALQTAAETSDTAEVADDVDLDLLLAAFDDDEAGPQPTRSGACTWQVAA